ncbi:TRAP transporter small permease [Aquisalimonas lutea]|uniref:TRAP transporter small permease n=1 Tax=Aquisalimonas lutea TaxID=1327750 RepID=UPI0025B462EC|nr:TRAP transporter small permease [Aquisalimonas lutea]MDN3519563.1 TRAP transporter small permease [Aquisalimonas lutea]
MLKVTRVLALLGTVALLVAVALTVTDIALRSVSRLTVPGLTDIVTLCTMIGAMLAIPYGFAADEHVSVDLFTSGLPETVQRLLAVAAAVMAVVVLAGVLWFSYQQMLTEIQYGDRSQSIGIPMVWYWLPLLIGMAASLAVNLWLIVRLSTGRNTG